MISGHIKLVTQWQRNNFKKAKYSSCQLRRELERTKMDNPFQVAYPIHVPSWWSTFSPPSITSPISRTHRNLSGFISSWRFKKKKEKAYIITQKYGAWSVQFMLLEQFNNVLKALGSFPLLCCHPYRVGSDLSLLTHHCGMTVPGLCVTIHTTCARFYIAILGVH